MTELKMKIKPEVYALVRAVFQEYEAEEATEADAGQLTIAYMIGHLAKIV